MGAAQDVMVHRTQKSAYASKKSLKRSWRLPLVARASSLFDCTIVNVIAAPAFFANGLMALEGTDILAYR